MKLKESGISVKWRGGVSWRNRAAKYRKIMNRRKLIISSISENAWQCRRNNVMSNGEMA